MGEHVCVSNTPNDVLMSEWHLRFTVTANCNYRCKYCIVHSEHSKDMHDNELKEILLAVAKNGVTKVHWTGGEPLVKPNIIDLMKYAKSIGFSEQYMTTNGYFLYDVASELRNIGVRRINISLDTLSSARFKELTGRDALPQVLRGIDRILEITDATLKTNSVMMKGNLHELHDIVALAVQKNKAYGKNRLISKFIQFSPSNPNQLSEDGQKFWTEQYIGSEDILNEIKKIGITIELPKNTVEGSNPSTRYYEVDGEFIVGLLATFSWGYPCGSCHRLVP